MSERIDPECPRCEGIELVWSEGYGYQCPACSLFVAIPMRNPGRVQGAEASGPGRREMTTRAQVAIFEELFGRSFGEGDRGSRQFDQAGDLAEAAISAAFRSEPAHSKGVHHD